MNRRDLVLAALPALCCLPALPAVAQTLALPPDPQVTAKAAALFRDPRSPVLGNPAGDVTIVEFFDYDCPDSKAAEPRIEDLLLKDPGVKLVLKEFPILTPQSLTASKLALAAARQGKYAEFHASMLLYHGRWSEEAVFDTARRAGVNLARARLDMASPEISDAIYADMNLARGLRIFQTPTFIIGGRIVTQPTESLDFAEAVAIARSGSPG